MKKTILLIGICCFAIGRFGLTEDEKPKPVCKVILDSPFPIFRTLTFRESLHNSESLVHGVRDIEKSLLSQIGGLSTQPKLWNYGKATGIGIGGGGIGGIGGSRQEPHSCDEVVISTLGELKSEEAVPLLLDLIDYRNRRGPQFNSLAMVPRWPYPAMHALGQIGLPACRATAISLRSEKDQTRRNLMVQVIHDSLGKRVGKTFLEVELDRCKTEEEREHLQVAIVELEAMK